ncbi:hypothetical protein [Falsiporphyromonas endometrii]|uniref:Uncharacterized protein n=1 Tax=Falsiporphyromonas endometrii TaxID=1387297 RepID=A0ABV9K690_9PORP
MGIIILLTFLLIIVLLGGSFLQEGKICLVDLQQIDDFVAIKYTINRSPYHWAVKFVMRGCYLLNIVAYFNTQKATQTTLIQLQNLNFEG